MKILAAFGIDYRILIAQFINFALLLFILYKIGYKPILAFIKERTGKIEQGITDAKEAKVNLKVSKKERREMLVDARKQASVIIEESRQKSIQDREAALKKTKGQIQEIVISSKRALKLEREKMMGELRSEVLEMVVQTTGQVLGGAVDEKIDTNWLSKQLVKFHKNK